jgi:hypothetical protein
LDHHEKKAIIVGIPSTATYRVRREVGNKKVKIVNMQKLKPRHCGDGEGPPDQDLEEPGSDTKGRRIPEENETGEENMTEEDRDHNATPEVPHQEKTQVQEEMEEQGEQETEQEEREENAESDHREQEDDKSEEERSEDKEANKNRKRYNLRKRKGRTVYVSASKVFRLDNLRDTDGVIEAMKIGYKICMGGSFFAGNGGGGKTQRQNKRGNQQINQDTEDNNNCQPQPDMPDAQPQQQQQKQPRMLSNLARYNAPGIKDNKKVAGKRNQRDNHQMAKECETKRNRIAKSDMQHWEKQQRMMENIRAEIVAGQQGSTLPSTTTPTSSRTASPITSPEA